MDEELKRALEAYQIYGQTNLTRQNILAAMNTQGPYDTPRMPVSLYGINWPQQVTATHHDLSIFHPTAQAIGQPLKPQDLMNRFTPPASVPSPEPPIEFEPIKGVHERGGVLGWLFGGKRLRKK